MFFSKEQIEQSLKRLSDLDPFLGITFLAFKKVQPPIGRVVYRNSFSILATFLQQYYQPIEDYSGFYNPFQIRGSENKRWDSVSPSYIKTQERSIHAHSSDIIIQERIIHESSSIRLTQIGWGWQPQYIDAIASKYLKNSLLPTFDLAVWLFRGRQWQNDVKSIDVTEAFFAEFFIDQDERKLFDVSPPLLATPWLEEHPISTEALLNILGDPPDRITEGILQKIELTDVGPADQLEFELASRLNIITGDNGLGKTFLLECVWRVLTGNWIGYPARPRQDAINASIVFQIGKPDKYADIGALQAFSPS